MAHSKLLGIREKRNVSTGKTRLCLEYIIEKHDIVWYFDAWNALFAGVETNKKLMVIRVWYPENYMLLDNKELDKDKNNKHMRDT